MNCSKIVITACAAFISIAMCSHAQGHGQGDSHDAQTEATSLSMYTDPEGNQYEMSVLPSQIIASPEWNGKGDPPLSVGSAIANARAWLKENYAGFDEFLPENISLGRIYAQAADHRWYYTLLMNASGTLGGIKVRHQFSVALLLDGTVVVPKPYISENLEQSSTDKAIEEGDL